MKQKVLDLIFQFEGGFVNNPDDPGGATNLGITQSTYNSWRAHKGLPIQPVNVIDKAEAGLIYNEDYWIPSKSDVIAEINDKLSVIHFDNAVNCGVTSAAKMLQEALGVAMDGKIGPKTILAIVNDNDVVAKYVSKRMDYYLDLVLTRKQMLQFLPSWMRRLQKLLLYAS